MPPASEEACLVLLPVLATVVMRRGKKSVVCVAALVPVHRTPPLPSAVYRFLDPIGVSVQDCRHWPVGRVVVAACTSQPYRAFVARTGKITEQGLLNDMRYINLRFTLLYLLTYF